MWPSSLKPLSGPSRTEALESEQSRHVECPRERLSSAVKKEDNDSEKKLLLLRDAGSNQLDHSSSIKTQKQRSLSWLAKLQLVLVLATALAFTIYFRDRLTCHFDESPMESTATPSFGLVKYQAPATTSSAAATSTPVLECFQVYQPVLTPAGVTDETITDDGTSETTTIDPVSSGSSCTVTLMDYHFANSYGAPFVGSYTPPSCNFNRVTMNFTLTSKGRQFDRLALMYMNDTEVWRTSTAEPTSYGISETYIKDMSEYLYFWNQPQKIIFDLGNIVDDTYTGVLNTTLIATFFTSEDTVDPADLIIPISARKSDTNAASVFTLPGDNATNTISFPKNANRAVFTVSACGQATEEFWWSNVLQSDIDTFLNEYGVLYGYSPFREVQVFIDGQLAGVQWPFPVIFTGGVVPGLWRPIVGIDAFDLREHEIDISPWLPILCDGGEHSFEIRVAGLLDDGETSANITESVGSNWVVTGKIFVWLDDEGSITTGTAPTLSFPLPMIAVSQTITQDSNGTNETLTYSTDVQRTLSVVSTVTTQNGSQQKSWNQSLAFSNTGVYLAYGNTQINNQQTTGLDQSGGGGLPAAAAYSAQYAFPLYANSTYWVDPSGSGNFTLQADLSHGLDLTVRGAAVLPTGLQPFGVLPATASLVDGRSGSALHTVQNGTAFYLGVPSQGTSSGYGSTQQDFSFTGVDLDDGSADVELYHRFVEAVNGTIVQDSETLVGAAVGDYSSPAELVGSGGASRVHVLESPRQALGRGPGQPKQVLVQGSGN